MATAINPSRIASWTASVPTDGGTVHGHARVARERVGELGLGAVVAALDQGVESRERRVIELARGAAAVREARERAGLAVGAQVLEDGVAVDGEALGELAHAALAGVVRLDDALPQVNAVRLRSPSNLKPHGTMQARPTFWLGRRANQRDITCCFS